MLIGVLLFMGNMIFSDKRDLVVEKKKDDTKKILQLNQIGNNADDTVVESVKLLKKDKQVFGVSRKAYEVEEVEYSDKDLKKLLGN